MKKVLKMSYKKFLQQKIINYLIGKECIKCGESDNRCLQFHHVNPSTKLFNISEGVNKGYKWELIEQELKKTEICCANCHSKTTAKDRNFYKIIQDNYEEYNNILEEYDE